MCEDDRTRMAKNTEEEKEGMIRSTKNNRDRGCRDRETLRNKDREWNIKRGEADPKAQVLLVGIARVCRTIYLAAY